MPSFVIWPIMKGAGLTHGGFYGHFRSKDRCRIRLPVGTAPCRPGEWLRHRGFAPRDGAAGRRHALRRDRAYARTTGPFSQLLRGGTAASRRNRAIAILAGINGALMLARAVEDPSLSEEILTAA